MIEIPTHEGQPMKALKQPVFVPATIVLPTRRDTEGRLWPAGGIQQSRVIGLAELREAGCVIEWRDPEGEKLDSDAAEMLIKQRMEDMSAGCQPEFADDVPREATPLDAEEAN